MTKTFTTQPMRFIGVKTLCAWILWIAAAGCTNSKFEVPLEDDETSHASSLRLDSKAVALLTEIRRQGRRLWDQSIASDDVINTLLYEVPTFARDLGLIPRYARSGRQRELVAAAHSRIALHVKRRLPTLGEVERHQLAEALLAFTIEYQDFVDGIRVALRFSLADNHGLDNILSGKVSLDQAAADAERGTGIELSTVVRDLSAQREAIVSHFLRRAEGNITTEDAPSARPIAVIQHLLQDLLVRLPQLVALDHTARSAAIDDDAAPRLLGHLYPTSEFPLLPSIGDTTP